MHFIKQGTRALWALLGQSCQTSILNYFTEERELFCRKKQHWGVPPSPPIEKFLLPKIIAKLRGIPPPQGKNPPSSIWRLPLRLRQFAQICICDISWFMCASALFSCTLCACDVHLMWTAHCKCRRTEARLKPKLKHKPSLVHLLKLLLAVEPPGRKRARRPNGSKLDQAFFFLSFQGVQLNSFFLSSFFPEQAQFDYASLRLLPNIFPDMNIVGIFWQVFWTSETLCNILKFR